LANVIIQRQIFVSGRVQGIFFRDSCVQQAMQLKLSGGVRNLQDGRVEVQVFGAAAAVNELIKWLKIGPKHAKVSIIEVVNMAMTEMAITDMNTKDRAAEQFVVWPTK